MRKHHINPPAQIIQNNGAMQLIDFLSSAAMRVTHYSAPEKFAFINAWDEWPKGSQQKGDLKHSRNFLLAVNNLVDKHKGARIG
jgi:hypothetical protein